MTDEHTEPDRLTQQAETALKEAAQKVANESRRSGGNVVVWQHGQVVKVPVDQLPPADRPRATDERT